MAKVCQRNAGKKERAFTHVTRIKDVLLLLAPGNFFDTLINCGSEDCFCCIREIFFSHRLSVTHSLHLTTLFSISKIFIWLLTDSFGQKHSFFGSNHVCLFGDGLSLCIKCMDYLILPLSKIKLRRLTM